MKNLKSSNDILKEWNKENIKNLIRGSEEWLQFVMGQKKRIQERLQRYNNVNTVKEQLSETGNISPYQRYKITVVSKFLNEAMETIDSGKYGICKKCKKEISMERLFLVPGSLRCVNCQT